MINDHGGGCCGMYHVNDLDDDCTDFVSGQGEIPSFERLQQTVNRAIEAQGDQGCIEIVLTGPMLKDWRGKVVKLGFRRVNKFVNGNSGNTCYVYHLLTNQLKKAK